MIWKLEKYIKIQLRFDILNINPVILNIKKKGDFEMSKIHTNVVIGRRYRHVSGRTVRVCAVPTLEGTNEEYVVYQESNKDHTVLTQPKSSFLALIDSPIQPQEFVPV